MLENRKYLIFVLMLVFILSISAAGESANSNFKSDNVKNNIHPKIESGLLEENQGMGIESAFPAQYRDQNTKRVVFELKDCDKSHIRSLEDSGAVVEAVYEDLVQASVPVSQLQAMSDLPFVNYIRSPRIPFKDIISEGVGVINATPIHNLGVRGKGIKIAILDVGFEGYQSKLGSELPVSGNVTVRSFRTDRDITGGGQNHGTAVAEIIYDVAPDAKLYLINFGYDVEFPDAVDYAISQNVDIISMSLGWLDGPFDGTSTISAKVDSAVSGGIVWVNSAGNYAQRHWQGKFIDTDNDKIHDFAPGDENMSIISGGNIEIFLSWDDWPASDQDYNLYVYNSTGYLSAFSETVQDGTQPPVEKISRNLPPGTYNLQIRKYNATRDVNFELYIGSYDVIENQYQVPSSSLSIPADAQGAITVGATYWSNDILEFFSSRGPTDDGRTKPDVVAPDGVQTSITLLPFYGTSASAPHVAGAAALLKSVNSSLTPASLRSALQSTARSLGDPNSYGAGRIDVWKAAVMVDKKPPAINISSPINGQILNNSIKNVTGTASDNLGLDKVEVKVGNGTWQKAQGTTSWSAAVTISQEGQNTIFARASDTAGNTFDTSITVISDTTLPIIIIESPANEWKLNTSKITVKGTASDDHGLNKVEVRVGNEIWGNVSGTKSWSVNITLSTGLNTISARAIDNAGNIQISSINVTLDTTLPTITIESPKEGQRLNTSDITVTGTASDNDLNIVEVRLKNEDWKTAQGIASWSAAVTLLPGQNKIFVRAIDTAGNTQETSVNVTLDTIKPEVTNLRVSTSTPIVNNPLDIEAKVIDDYPENLSSFVLVEAPDSNISKCPMVDSGTGLYKCKFETTSRYGRYNITIVASDLAGNVNDTEKTWFVTKTKPYENTSVYTVENNITEINALKEVNTTLELVTSMNVNKDFINITMKNDIPPEMNRSMGLVPFGKYISIDPGNDIVNSLIWMKLRIYYTESELITSGLDENSLRISYYNESNNRWESLSKGSPSWVNDAGVNSAKINDFSGFVWANISHNSTFALVGSYPAPAQLNLQSSSPSGGGGGGGGGGASDENYSNIELREKYYLHIFKDMTTIYKFSNESNPIQFVNITGNINAGEVNTVVEVLKNTSSLVTIQPPGTVYKNANIWVGTSGFAVPKNIKNAVIRFRVPNTWLESNGIASGDMKMVRWDSSKWVTLDTEVMEKDGVNTYFEATTTTFSPFAATGIRSVQSDAFSENGTLNVLQPEPTGTNGINANGVAPPINFVVITGVLILFILIIAVFFLKRDRYLKR